MLKNFSKVWIWFRALNRDAALDSLRNVLAVLGLGSILANLGTMRLWLMLPAFALCFAVWFGDYVRHEGL